MTETRRPFRAGSKTDSKGSALCLMEITCGHDVSLAVMSCGRVNLSIDWGVGGGLAHLWHTVDVLCDQALVSPAMIPLEVDRELGVDSEGWLYANNYITGLVCDS